MKSIENKSKFFAALGTTALAFFLIGNWALQDHIKNKVLDRSCLSPFPKSADFSKVQGFRKDYQLVVQFRADPTEVKEWIGTSPGLEEIKPEDGSGFEEAAMTWPNHEAFRPARGYRESICYYAHRNCRKTVITFLFVSRDHSDVTIMTSE